MLATPYPQASTIQLIPTTKLDNTVVDNEECKLNSKENKDDPIDRMDEENIQLSAKEMMRIYRKHTKKAN